MDVYKCLTVKFFANTIIIWWLAYTNNFVVFYFTFDIIYCPFSAVDTKKYSFKKKKYLSLALALALCTGFIFKLIFWLTA